MNRIKIIVAEKSYLIRKGIVSVINRIEGATVVYEMENLNHVNSVILNHNPHYIVINPNLFPENQTFLNFEIKADLSKKGIAIHSVPPFRNGLLKKFKLILSVNDSKEILFEKLEKLIHSSYSSSQYEMLQKGLSDREKTILSHVAKGETNKEIAENLHLSAHTVITHRKNITAKLGIKTISGLTVYAILNNLVDVNELK